jgi:hypothetical protein
VTQAVDKAAHWGYDTFHRALDEQVVGWIIDNGKTATADDFLTFLRTLYSLPELLARFPNGLP